MKLNPFKNKHIEKIILLEQENKEQKETLEELEQVNVKLLEELQAFRDTNEQMQKNKEFEAEVDKRTLEEKKKLAELQQNLAEDSVKVKSQLKYGAYGKISDRAAYMVSKMSDMDPGDKRRYMALMLSIAKDEEINMDFAKGSHLLHSAKNVSQEDALKFVNLMGAKPDQQLPPAPKRIKATETKARRKKK